MRVSKADVVGIMAFPLIVEGVLYYVFRLLNADTKLDLDHG